MTTLPADFRSLRAGRRRVIAACLVLGLLLAGPAQAGFNLFLTPAVDPLSFPGNAGLGLGSSPDGIDWASYILSVSSDDGSLVQAVDVNLLGTFRQQLNWDIDAENWASTTNGSSTGNGDSHFLAPTNALFPINPSEDYGLSPSALSVPGVTGSPTAAIGSSMHSVWAIPNIASSSMNLAYLVMPRGSESQLQYAIDGADPNGNIAFQFRQGASFPTPPPPLPPIEVPVIVPPIPPHVPEPGLPPIPPANPPANQPPVEPVAPAPSLPPALPTPPAPGPINPPQHAPPTAPNLHAWATRLLTSSDNPLPPGFAAYELNVSSNDGNMIGAVDVRIDGPLHQKWADSDGDGVDDATPRGLAIAGSDSHLLIPQNGLPIQLNEDSGVTPSPLEGGTSGTSIGSSLSGVWGIVNQSPTAQLAYLVVPESMDFHDLGISVAAATSTGDLFTTLTAKNFNVLNHDGSVLLRAAEPIIPAASEPAPPTIDEIVNLPPIVSDPPGGAADPTEPADIFPPEDPIGDTGQITIYPYPTIITIDEASGEWIRVRRGFWNETLVPFDGTLTLEEIVPIHTIDGTEIVLLFTGARGGEFTTAEYAPHSLQTAVKTNLQGVPGASYVNFFANDSLNALRFGDSARNAADSQTAQAPEPGSLALVGLALVGWVRICCRQR